MLKVQAGPVYNNLVLETFLLVYGVVVVVIAWKLDLQQITAYASREYHY